MSQSTEIIKALLRGIFLLGAFALVLVGLFVAWWIVVFALALISVYLALRRLIGSRRGPAPGAPGRTAEPRSGETVVIDGEYRIEHDADGSVPPRDRGEGG